MRDPLETFFAPSPLAPLPQGERGRGEGGVIILDGALATELERRGADINDPLWSAKVLLEAPELIRQVHYDYFAAGADVATTASYQATFAGFDIRGLTHQQAADLMRLSVRLARDARAAYCEETRSPRKPLVAASIGCYGAYLHDGSEYRGDYGLSLQQLMDFHRPRMEVLAEGVDLFACETVPCALEAEALVRLLEEFDSIPAWLSFSCRDAGHVCHGERLADCFAMAASVPQVVALGINCTAPRHIDGLLRSVTPSPFPLSSWGRGARGEGTKPILVYPNSGESWDAVKHEWRSDTAACLDWKTAARRWLELGARGIGGCCRTTPQTIREIAAALSARKEMNHGLHGWHG